jgi:hypothetical protein
MSLDLPKAGAGKPHVEEDWRAKLVETASSAGSRLETRERSRNPMIPDNFMDLSDAGFPADLIVSPVQIPRQDVPAEMAQYRDMLNLQWLHLPWSAISANGGLDGKASVPGAVRIDLGGSFVVALAGHYLMYANRHQYEARRDRNVRRYQESVTTKMESRTEALEGQGRKGSLRFDSTDTGPMTVEELFEYEKSIGDEASIKGARLG